MSTVQASELTDIFSSNHGKYSITYTGPSNELARQGQRLTTNGEDFIARGTTFITCFTDNGETIRAPMSDLDKEQLADIIWQEHLAYVERTPIVL